MSLLQTLKSKTPSTEIQPFITDGKNSDTSPADSKEEKIKKKSNVGNIVSFILLTFQTAAVVLLMRYSRLQHTDDDTPSFAVSSAVTCAEIGKCLVGIIVTLYQIVTDPASPKRTPQSALARLKNEIFKDWKIVIKMSVPAFLYMVQNCLLYTALNHLGTFTKCNLLHITR